MTNDITIPTLREVAHFINGLTVPTSDPNNKLGYDMLVDARLTTHSIENDTIQVLFYGGAMAIGNFTANPDGTVTCVGFTLYAGTEIDPADVIATDYADFEPDVEKGWAEVERIMREWEGND